MLPYQFRNVHDLNENKLSREGRQEERRGKAFVRGRGLRRGDEKREGREGGRRI